ncbi:MAG: Calx-beta domain-containing protein [Acidobacteriota bacterium]
MRMPLLALFAGLLVASSPLRAQVPADELEWLERLFKNTGGESWIDNSGWIGPRGTECDWFGVTCASGTGMRSIVAIDLSGNRLRGALPSVSSLSAIERLDLSDNGLVGEIPGSLLELETLVDLDLSSNALAGPLPNVAALSLSTLDVRFNKLFGDGSTEQAFEGIQPGWADTQTVPPSNVRVIDPSVRAVTVQWRPIEYVEDGGGYRVLAATSRSGPFREVQSTQDKERNQVRVSGLEPGIRYFFAVATVTRAHDDNRNVLTSTKSDTASLPDAGYFVFNPLRATAVESRGAARIGVVRIGTRGAVSVDLRTEEGSATEDVDYVPTTATLTWADGEDGPKFVPVTLLDDDLAERSEFFGVTLGRPGGGALLPNASRTAVVIQDDDFPRRPRRSLAAAASRPAVAFAEDGRKLVAWQDRDRDGFGVSAILLSAEGEPLGAPFRVNRSQAGDQTAPDVAFAADGSFAIAWRNADAAAARGGNGGNLVATFFDPQAVAETEEAAIDTASSAASSDPVVDSSNEGDITVSWQDQNGDVRAATADAQSTSAPVAVTSDAEPGSEPQTATSAVGQYVVVWESSLAAKGQAAGLVGATFAPGNAEPVAEFSVSSASSASNPSVATADNGDFVVAWQEEDSGSGTDIMARLYSADGTAKGEAFRVNQTTAGDQSSPHVGANSAGDFAIVWSDERAAKGANGSALIGAFFDPGGEAKTGEEVIAEAQANSTPAAADVTIDDSDEVTVVYELLDDQGEATGVFSEGFSSVVTPGVCMEDASTLCLNGGRFEVTASWRTTSGDIGPGSAVALSDDTGYFWFFDEENVEITLKVLDGCAINGRYWVFAGGLTDVEVDLTVTDTESGISRSYTNPRATSFEPIQDTSAFSDCTGSELLSPPRNDPESSLRTLWQSSEGTATSAANTNCDELTDALCLNAERFAVSIEWTTSQETSGVGRPVTLTGDTGTFWFFDEQNVEVVIKVLDACAINGRYWVFAAGLTDVAAQLTVTDTASGAFQVYANELGAAFRPIQDTDAFSTCP